MLYCAIAIVGATMLPQDPPAAVAAQATYDPLRLRIDAAFAMSPSSPAIGKPAVAFGRVKIPWLLMTGTHDVAAIGDAAVASRLAVYPWLHGDGPRAVMEAEDHWQCGSAATVLK